MSAIKSWAIVQRVTVGSRAFDIERTAWKYTHDVSFDVHDVETGQCLTPESLDDWPSVQKVADLLVQLREDLESGTLDPFFLGVHDDLRMIVAASSGNV